MSFRNCSKTLFIWIFKYNHKKFLHSGHFMVSFSSPWTSTQSYQAWKFWRCQRTCCFGRRIQSLNSFDSWRFLDLICYRYSIYIEISPPIVLEEVQTNHKLKFLYVVIVVESWKSYARHANPWGPLSMGSLCIIRCFFGENLPTCASSVGAIFFSLWYMHKIWWKSLKGNEILRRLTESFFF